MCVCLNSLKREERRTQGTQQMLLWTQIKNLSTNLLCTAGPKWGFFGGDGRGGTNTALVATITNSENYSQNVLKTHSIPKLKSSKRKDTLQIFESSLAAEGLYS